MSTDAFVLLYSCSYIHNQNKTVSITACVILYPLPFSRPVYIQIKLLLDPYESYVTLQDNINLTPLTLTLQLMCRGSNAQHHIRAQHARKS